MLDSESDLDCYLDAINRNQNRPCDFLDDSEKTYLNIQNNRTIEFLQASLKNLDSTVYSNKRYFIMDNTKFPENGANYKNPFKVEVLHHLNLIPSDEYYLKAILCNFMFIFE